MFQVLFLCILWLLLFLNTDFLIVVQFSVVLLSLHLLIKKFHMQQFEVIKVNTNLRVGEYYGAKGVDEWNIMSWEKEINEHDVSCILLTRCHVIKLFSCEIQVWCLYLNGHLLSVLKLSCIRFSYCPLHMDNEAVISIGWQHICKRILHCVLNVCS